MSCDVCGEQTMGRPTKVVIEGAIVVACPRCARLGKPYVAPPSHRMRPRAPLVQYSAKPTRSAPRETLEELEVVEDFSARIRKAREKIGLTQDDLARRIKEKLSIIQKIESGKITPDMKLCRELEHSLRISLLAPRVEMPISTTIGPSPGLTLGDVVKVKRKDQSEAP